MKWFAAILVAVTLAACGSSSSSSGGGGSTTTTAPAGSSSTVATTATTKAAAGPIFTQNGSGTATTATFKVPNSWDLAWSYDCSGFPGGTGNFITTNYDLTGSAGGDAASGGNIDFDNQGINQLGASGSGVEHYHSGGNTKYIKVVSLCGWTLTVTKA